MERLLTIEQVHEATGYPIATLRFWRHQGTGPPSARIGRRVVYREQEVARWIDEQFEAEREGTPAR